MPKQTFLNLPDVKQKTIMESALKEFSSNDYENVSISAIVANAGIAKGSFYQYFNNKEDLYCYLLEFVQRKQMEFILQKYPPGNEKDFFTQAQNMIEAGVDFGFCYPVYNRIIYRALFGNLSVHQLTKQYFSSVYLNHTRQLISMGISMGAIREDINIDLVAHMLNLIMSNFTDFAIDKLKVEPEKLVVEDYVQDDRRKLYELIADVINILRFGLEKT